MRYLGWQDEYLQMNKPMPQPRKVKLEKIKLTLGNEEEISVSIGKEIKNILKNNPWKITFELMVRDKKVFRNYRLSSNKKKRNKKKER